MRILIVRIGRAGDMVMTTPAISALLQSCPDADFTLLTSKDGNRLLKNFHPRINEILTWDRSSLFHFLQKRHLKQKIKAENFDAIICFETSKSIVSLFDGIESRLFLNNATDKKTHSARQYLDIVQRFSNQAFEDIAVNLPVSSEAESKVERELAALGIASDDVVIMLHPSNSGYSRFAFRKRKTLKHRLWPASSFAELGTLLHQYNPGLKIIIDLLPEEKALGESIVEKSNNTIILITEKPNFERYKALLKRAQLFVSPNTGPMHIAAAVNTRIVTLFSGWDPADCGPFMAADLYTIIRAEDMAHPDKGLSAISASTVFEACKKQLSQLQNQ